MTVNETITDSFTATTTACCPADLFRISAKLVAQTTFDTTKSFTTVCSSYQVIDLHADQFQSIPYDVTVNETITDSFTATTTDSFTATTTACYPANLFRISANL